MKNYTLPDFLIWKSEHPLPGREFKLLNYGEDKSSQRRMPARRFTLADREQQASILSAVERILESTQKDGVADTTGLEREIDRWCKSCTN